MIDKVKMYVVWLVIGSCVGYVAWLHFDLVTTENKLLKVTAEFKSYKGEVNDQVQKNIAETARTNAEREAKHAAEKLAGAAANRKLVLALERLRNAEAVSRGEAVFLANGSGSPVPRTTEDSGGTVVALATYEGTASIGFYSDAIMDNLQCDRLIEFVKGMR